MTHSDRQSPSELRLVLSRWS